MPFNDSSFDLIISSAVLHFAQSKQHFEAMLYATWRALKPGGYLFARLASDIGIENLLQPLGNGRYLLPDGSERYLVNEAQLLYYTKQLNGYLHEPIKTTNVQNLRCMTTWCLQKLQ
ncbi:methyltransferase domain-containing protein [Mucilaginibacter lacusdianchii]|uniref:methyltransferase domain-containing protein n=1 Tax=Mucilaginibacter lacusdianchii TaxID=2684211 RepID=UPI002104553C|nr:methyltransferase domain-containing protein [Mucilaginibacter sp. JXJ CY 39]